MDMDQVAEIFRMNMTRLVRDAAARNIVRWLAAGARIRCELPSSGALTVGVSCRRQFAEWREITADVGEYGN